MTEINKKEIEVELSNIISKIQGSLFVQKKQSPGLKFKYRDSEDIMSALKPFLEMYSIQFQFSHDEIFTVTTNITTTTKKTNDGTIVKIEDDIKRIFLKTKLVAIYKGVETVPRYTITDIETRTIGGMGSCNSSQAFGAHESYAKKRALGNFFLVTTDDVTSDPDSHPEKKSCRNNKNPSGNIWDDAF